MGEVGPKGDDEPTGDSIRPNIEEDDGVAEDGRPMKMKICRAECVESETEKKRQKIVKTTG